MWQNKNETKLMNYVKSKMREILHENSCECEWQQIRWMERKKEKKIKTFLCEKWMESKPIREGMTMVCDNSSFVWGGCFFFRKKENKQTIPVP